MRAVKIIRDDQNCASRSEPEDQANQPLTFTRDEKEYFDKLSKFTIDSIYTYMYKNSLRIFEERNLRWWEPPTWKEIIKFYVAALKSKYRENLENIDEVINAYVKIMYVFFNQINNLDQKRYGQTSIQFKMYWIKEIISTFLSLFFDPDLPELLCPPPQTSTLKNQMTLFFFNKLLELNEKQGVHSNIIMLGKVILDFIDEGQTFESGNIFKQTDEKQETKFIYLQSLLQLSIIIEKIFKNMDFQNLTVKQIQEQGEFLSGYMSLYRRSSELVKKISENESYLSDEQRKYITDFKKKLLDIEQAYYDLNLKNMMH